MLAVDQVINDTYQVTGYVGSGGGGIVYKARHLRLETDVVIKQIREEVKDRIYLRQEADILKNLKHPYLPRVYDFLMTEDGVYTVMDFVPGKGLDRLLAENGKVSQDRALRWLNQLAEALAYLHGMNPPIIHSDIKPANIIITPEDNAVLIDFNVSICIDDADKFSVGISAGYAPPEQYRDLMTYQRITNITNTKNTKIEEIFSTITQASKTVYLYEPEKEQTDATEILGRESDADATEILGRAGDADATELLGRAEDTDATEILGRESDTDATGLLPQSKDREVKNGKVRHKKLVVDTRSDVYSLGCVLYHIISGKAPALDFNAIIPIRELEPGISEGIVVILEKMMSLLPDERYQNGEELLYAFRHIYDLDSEYRSYRRGRRNKKLAVVCLYLLGGVLVAGGVLTIRSEKNTDYNRMMMSAETCFEEGSFDEAEAILEDAKALLPLRAEAYEKEAQLLYQKGDYDGCILYCEEILRDAPYKLTVGQESDALGNIYYTLGNAYLEKEDYGNAVLNLGNAISEYDQNSLYYRDFAIAQAKTGNIEAAKSALENVELLGLGEDSICMVQGEIAYAQGEYVLAEECLQKAVSTAESDSLRRRAVLLCDRVYQALGSAYTDQAITLLEREETELSGSGAVNSLTERLAAAYVRKADETGDAAYYRKALEKFESMYSGGYVTRQILENIAILYEDLDDFDQAQSVLLTMAEQYADSYVPYKRLAFLEADRQQEKANEEREYSTMKIWYDRARELYDEETGDQEMQMLDVMLGELQDGGWL